jgi:hypothetical protein
VVLIDDSDSDSDDDADNENDDNYVLSPLYGDMPWDHFHSHVKLLLDSLQRNLFAASRNELLIWIKYAFGMTRQTVLNAAARKRFQRTSSILQQFTDDLAHAPTTAALRRYDQCVLLALKLSAVYKEWCTSGRFVPSCLTSLEHLTCRSEVRKVLEAVQAVNVSRGLPVGVVPAQLSREAHCELMVWVSEWIKTVKSLADSKYRAPRA